jgi:hypothetical protein
LRLFLTPSFQDRLRHFLFGRVVDRIATLRVVLIVTFRPEFEPPWVGRPHVTALTLNRLTQREIDAMIDRVVGNKPIPASVRHDIIERTDGIPALTIAGRKKRLCVESTSTRIDSFSITGTSIGAADVTSTLVNPPPIAAPASAAEPARNSRLRTMLAICLSMPHFEDE